MKKLFFLTVIFSSFFFSEAAAQKKKTYVKDVYLICGYEKKCIVSGDFNGGDESRISVKVNGDKMGVIGKDLDRNLKFYSKAAAGNDYDRNYQTPYYLTQDGKGSLYIGAFSSDEEFTIKWDLWEDDSGNEWEYDGSWNDHDDDLEDTVTIASSKGHKIYDKKSNGCLEVKYTIYQE